MENKLSCQARIPRLYAFETRVKSDRVEAGGQEGSSNAAMTHIRAEDATLGRRQTISKRKAHDRFEARHTRAVVPLAVCVRSFTGSRPAREAGTACIEPGIGWPRDQLQMLRNLSCKGTRPTTPYRLSSPLEGEPWLQDSPTHHRANPHVRLLMPLRADMKEAAEHRRAIPRVDRRRAGEV